MNVKQTLDLILKNGGGTFTKQGASLEVSQGYAVSLAGKEVKLDLSLPRPILEAALNAYIAWAEFEVEYLGAWIDGNTLYLDVSEVYTNEVDAKRAAIQRKQLAYFDFSRMAAVNVA